MVVHIFVLIGYIFSHGEVLFSSDGTTVYFARDGTPLTNFVAIPLNVIHKYKEEGVEDYVELLILGEKRLSKIVTIHVRDLGSAKWIDDLGINY